jgi:hypothetical protein
VKYVDHLYDWQPYAVINIIVAGQVESELTLVSTKLQYVLVCRGETHWRSLSTADFGDWVLRPSTKSGTSNLALDWPRNFPKARCYIPLQIQG